MEETVIDQASQYLTFSLAKELYALEIDKIREVLELTEMTPIPQMPEVMKGVINLRGKVVPVIDFRKRFNLPETSFTEETCIIITEISSEEDSPLIGALVDSVCEVVEIKPSEIDSLQMLGKKVNCQLLTGIGKKNGQILMTLDLEKAFNCFDLESVTISESPKDLVA